MAEREFVGGLFHPEAHWSSYNERDLATLFRDCRSTHGSAKCIVDKQDRKFLCEHRIPFNENNNPMKRVDMVHSTNDNTRRSTGRRGGR